MPQQEKNDSETIPGLFVPANCKDHLDGVGAREVWWKLVWHPCWQDLPTDDWTICGTSIDNQKHMTMKIACERTCQIKWIKLTSQENMGNGIDGTNLSLRVCFINH